MRGFSHSLVPAVLALALVQASLSWGATVPPAGRGNAAIKTAPLVMGETFTLKSKVLGETRRINVYRPAGYDEAVDQRFPVLYMPDGGIAEDFLHVAGLVQVSTGNGTMRPFLLVGIENTERRRDMTGPTQNEDDKKIAPRVGGSAAFRQFVRQELMPAIRTQYRTSGETAIVGESLAGLFVVETLLLEPDLFDTYIAFDASLWWDSERLLKEAPERLAERPASPKVLFLATSVEDRGDAGKRFAELLGTGIAPDIQLHYVPMPAEHHATIYHPGALLAFRTVLRPAAP